MIKFAGNGVNSPMNAKDRSVLIREPVTPEDYGACQEAQRRAWGIVEEGYLVPVATLVGANRHGGLVLGAFLDDGRAVGLSFGFLARIGKRIGLYSQLTGVVPEFQGKGLGWRLKQRQFEFARAQGLECVAWAFDPIQEGNARFNLNKLGAIVSEYVVDMYGPRTDSLNVGMPTDRLIAVWYPDRPPTSEREPSAVDHVPKVVESGDGEQSFPKVQAINADASEVLLEVPQDLKSLRRGNHQLLQSWRFALRAGFTQAFELGYQATQLLRDDRLKPGRSYYLLQRS